MRLRFAGYVDGIDTAALNRLNLVSEPWQPSPKVKPRHFSPGRLPAPVHDDCSAPQAIFVVSNRQITVHLLCLGFGRPTSSSARVSTLPSTVSARCNDASPAYVSARAVPVWYHRGQQIRQILYRNTQAFDVWQKPLLPSSPASAAD